MTKLLRQVSPTVLFAAGAALQIMPIETGSFLVNEFCERWVYFLAGYLFAPQIFRLADWARANGIKAVLGLVAWAFANGVVSLVEIDLGQGSVVAELPPIGLIAGLSGATAIVVLASLLSRTALTAPLRYCGQNSIAIYLTFFLPMAASRYVMVKTGLIADVGSSRRW